VGVCKQEKDYSCGPIAMNRFAVLLKSFCGGNVQEEEGINDFIKNCSSDDENVANAKCLFRYLLETKQDFLCRLMME
jgi:hypothetical protein